MYVEAVIIDERQTINREMFFFSVLFFSFFCFAAPPCIAILGREGVPPSHTTTWPRTGRCSSTDATFGRCGSSTRLRCVSIICLCLVCACLCVLMIYVCSRDAMICAYVYLCVHMLFRCVSISDVCLCVCPGPIMGVPVLLVFVGVVCVCVYFCVCAHYFVCLYAFPCFVCFVFYHDLSVY